MKKNLSLGSTGKREKRGFSFLETGGLYAAKCKRGKEKKFPGAGGIWLLQLPRGEKKHSKDTVLELSIAFKGRKGREVGMKLSLLIRYGGKATPGHPRSPRDRFSGREEKSIWGTLTCRCGGEKKKRRNSRSLLLFVMAIVC